VDYKDKLPRSYSKTQQQLQATSAFHQTLGFGFFKAFDHTWFNNLSLFDEDKTLVVCVGLVWIWSSSCKTSFKQYIASMVAY